MKTSAPAYKSLQNLIIGGTELGGYQYFGRVFRNGRAVLGKLAGALALPLEGHEQYVYNNFEVLTYNNTCYHDHNCYSQLNIFNDCSQCFEVRMQ